MANLETHEREVNWLERRRKAKERGYGLVEALADMLKSILEWEAGHGRKGTEADLDDEAELTDPAGHVHCFKPRPIVLLGGKDDEHDDT